LRADNIAEFLRLDEAPLRADCISELLTLGDGLAANLAGRVDIVLCLDRGDNFGRRNAELREFVRLDPNAQRVLTAEDLYARNALDASELVLKIDDGVVG